MKKINIAVDGYSSCGKSTTARLLARRLKYIFIDSGAMYRAVTWYLIQHKISYENLSEILQALPNIELDFRPTQESEIPLIHLNGNCVEQQIRMPEISALVSEYSTVKEIRKLLVTQQQWMGRNGGVVMDGRDIGTVVFPMAELKVFLTAELDIRVMRRALELEEKGTPLSENEIQENLLHRDFIDTTRKESPLRKAETAVEIDTSYLDIEEQVEIVYNMAQSIIRENSPEDLVNS
jgi:cytidylate kinase